MVGIEKSGTDTQLFSHSRVRCRKDSPATAVAGAFIIIYENRVESRVSNGSWLFYLLWCSHWIPSPSRR